MSGRSVSGASQPRLLLLGDSFQTFNIKTPGFTDLASVTISGTGGYPTNEFAVDNLVLSTAGPTPGAGLLSLAFLVLAGLWTKARGFLAR